jgi:hypothetical protein
VPLTGNPVKGCFGGAGFAGSVADDPGRAILVTRE